MNAVVCSPDANRLVVFDVSGGMMDIGWAQRATPRIAATCQAFVDGTTRDLVSEIRGALDQLEEGQHVFVNVQLVALEIAAIPGGARIQVSRIGAPRIWICGTRPPRTLGYEDSWPFDSGAHVVTASLRSRRRWNARDDGGEGFVLVDETDIADDAARPYREESFDITDRNDVSLVVMNHPFWTEVDTAKMPSASTHAEITSVMTELVGSVSGWDALAAVVRVLPT